MKHKTLAYYKGSIATFVETQRELYVSQKRRFEAQQKERAHMQEMIDKYNPAKNSSEENKKNKRKGHGAPESSSAPPPERAGQNKGRGGRRKGRGRR